MSKSHQHEAQDVHSASVSKNGISESKVAQVVFLARGKILLPPDVVPLHRVKKERMKEVVNVI